MYLGIHSFKKYQHGLTVTPITSSIQKPGCSNTSRNQRPTEASLSGRDADVLSAATHSTRVLRVVQSQRGIHRKPMAPIAKKAVRQP